MTIKPAVKKDAETFISAAPDAAAPAVTAGVIRGNKRQITLTLDPVLVPAIDAASAELHISRAAWISMTLANALRK